MILPSYVVLLSHLSVCLSISIYFKVSIYLSIHPSIHLSVYHVCVHVCRYFSIDILFPFVFLFKPRKLQVNFPDPNTPVYWVFFRRGMSALFAVGSHKSKRFYFVTCNPQQHVTRISHVLCVLFVQRIRYCMEF